MTSEKNSRGPGPRDSLVNPYIVGNPIESKNLFFGRQDDFAFIRNKITGSGTGGILVLCGTRRSGKTSILFQIKNGRLGRDFFRFFDMQSLTVGRDAEFLARLGQEIALSLDQPDLQAAAERIRTVEDKAAYDEFRNFLEGMSGHLGGRQLVLLFDEYEIIEACIRDGRLDHGPAGSAVGLVGAGTRRVHHFYRQRQAGTAGSEILAVVFGQGPAPPHQFFEPGRHAAPDPRTGAGDITYDEAAPDLIFELTNGQPFYTQVHLPVPGRSAQ